MEKDRLPWSEIKREIHSCLILADLFMISISRTKIKRMIKAISTRDARKLEANQRTGDGVRKFFGSLSEEEKSVYVRKRVSAAAEVRERRELCQTTSGEGGGFRRSFTCPETGRRVLPRPVSHIREGMKRA